MIWREWKFEHLQSVHHGVSFSEEREYKERDEEGEDVIIWLMGEEEENSVKSLFRLIQESDIRSKKTASLKMYSGVIQEWNRELSPWKAPAVFGDDDFGEGAGETLNMILKKLNEYEELEGNKKSRYWLGGYSLAGLFVLWAAYQTTVFEGVAAVSPSVWFPGWREYAENHEICVPKVYLSLGNKEEKTRNPIMRQVGENIRRQKERLDHSSFCTECTLEWNEGNHFQEPELRMAKGFAWLLNCK